MADLQRVLMDDDTLDEQLQDRLLVCERRRGQALLDALTEGGQLGQDRLGLRPLAAQPRLLLPLLFDRLPLPGHVLAALGQFGEGDDAGLVAIEQAPLFPPEALHAGGELLGFRPFLTISLRGQLGLVLELGQQARRVVQQGDDVVPDRAVDVRTTDRVPRADPALAPQDRIPATTPVVAARGLLARGRVSDPVHRQPTAATGQQAAQQVVVLLVVTVGEDRVARPLRLRLVGGGRIDDGGHGDRDPVLRGPAALAGRTATAGALWAPWLDRRHVVVAIDVGGAGVDRIAQDMVDDRGRPVRLARTRTPGAGLEALEDLAHRQLFVDEPAVEHLDDRGFGLVDDQVARTPLLLRDISVAVGGDVGHVLAGARLVQLP